MGNSRPPTPICFYFGSGAWRDEDEGRGGPGPARERRGACRVRLHSLFAGTRVENEPVPTVSDIAQPGRAGPGRGAYNA